jgi:hypothetical protein
MANWEAKAYSLIPRVQRESVGFIYDGAVLNDFSMITTVETPLTVAAQELRIECLFPADDESEARHIALLDAARE